MEKPQIKLHFTNTQGSLAPPGKKSSTKGSVTEGVLERQIRQFLVSIAGVLTRDCNIEDWKQEFAADCHDYYISIQMFPKVWELPNLNPVALFVTWNNPFLNPNPEDLALELRIPNNWSGAKGLRELIDLNTTDLFSNLFDGDADESIAYRRYIPFQYFVGGSRLGLAGFYQAILSTFRRLLSLRPMIDDYIAQCSDGSEQRASSRHYVGLRNSNKLLIQ